jgi:Putative citrate transport
MQPTETGCGAGCVPGLVWAAPFLGILLSIALLPALAPRFWHRRMAWVSALWIAALLVPMAVATSPAGAAATAWDAILIQYLPFVTLLLALYAAGGGVLIRGGPAGTPAGNTLMLAVGMGLGIVMG